MKAAIIAESATLAAVTMSGRVRGSGVWADLRVILGWTLCGDRWNRHLLLGLGG
jgi:hypothetical protein